MSATNQVPQVDADSRALAVIAISVVAAIAVLVAIGILAGVDVPAMMEEVFTPAT